MVSSKELLELLRLLSAIPAEEKVRLLSYLSAQQGSGDSSRLPAFSQEKAGE